MNNYVKPTINAKRLPVTDLQAAKLGIAAAFLLCHDYSLSAIDAAEDDVPTDYLARINHNGVPVGYILRGGDEKLIMNPTSYGLALSVDWKVITESAHWPTRPPLYTLPEGPTWKPIKKGSLPPVGISVLVAIGEHLTVGSRNTGLDDTPPPEKDMVLDCQPPSPERAKVWYWMPLPDAPK